MKQEDFDEYIRQVEPSAQESAAAWRTAIGLQQVDGLNPSQYLLDVIVYGAAKVFPVQVIDRVAPKHPFLFGDVKLTKFTGMFKHAFENATMRCHKTVRVESESLGGENLLDIG